MDGGLFDWRIHLYKTDTEFMLMNLLPLEKKTVLSCGKAVQGLQDSSPLSGSYRLQMAMAYLTFCSLEVNVSCLLASSSIYLQFNASLKAQKYQDGTQKVSV